MGFAGIAVLDGKFIAFADSKSTKIGAEGHPEEDAGRKKVRKIFKQIRIRAGGERQRAARTPFLPGLDRPCLIAAAARPMKAFPSP